MSRIRTVKPELFRHEELFDAELESGLPLRLAFVGLFTVADCEGRFLWKPRTLKLDVLPHDVVDFSRVLAVLERYGFVQSYEVGGGKYGWIPTFTKHQRLQPKEVEAGSKLPAYPLSTAPEHIRVHTGNLPEHIRVHTGMYPEAQEVEEEEEEERETFNISAHPEISDPAALRLDTQTGNPVEVVFEQPHPAEPDPPIPDPPGEVATTPPLVSGSGYPLAFEALWADYPTRNGGNPKTKAFRSWSARKAEGCSLAEMHDGTRRYASWCAATGKLNTEFVQQASTFLGPQKNFAEPWALPADNPDSRSGVGVGSDRVKGRTVLEESLARSKRFQELTPDDPEEFDPFTASLRPAQIPQAHPAPGRLLEGTVTRAH